MDPPTTHERSANLPLGWSEAIGHSVFAFMEATDASKRQGGGPVRIADVIARAKLDKQN